MDLYLVEFHGNRGEKNSGKELKKWRK